MLELGIFDDSPHFQLTLPSACTRITYGEQASAQGNSARHPRLQGIDLALEVREHATGNCLRVTNFASTLVLEDGDKLQPGVPQTLAFPVRIFDSKRLLIIDDPARVSGDHQNLETIERPRQNGTDPVVSLEKLGRPPGAETISRWLEALSVLQQSAASGPVFFQRAAEFVTTPGGLDMALVLMRDGANWEIKSSCWVDEELGELYRHDIVDLVVTDARTFFHIPPTADQQGRVAPTTAVVASPIFDRNGTVVGVVYGARNVHRFNARQGIRPLEAQWVQLVAEAVSAGLTRLDAEAENVRTRVLLEQAFPPAVAQQLAGNPHALRPEQREVSLLFADIRESTQLATQLAPEVLNDVFTDILELLTRQVLQQEGAIVDYAGDGLAAMWNAPTPQANHATLACQAALGMLRALPAWNTKWSDHLPSELKLGIGVHTGIATVGNTGSHRRFKYGPRGPHVALASRVESSTKRLGVPLVITAATQRALPPCAVTRRLCTARFGEFDSTVDLFELRGLLPEDVSAEEKRWIAMHESALSAIASGHFDAACKQLVTMTHEATISDPLLDELLDRVERKLQAPNPPGDPAAPDSCLLFELSQ